MLDYYVYCEFRVDNQSEWYKTLQAKFMHEKDAFKFCDLKNSYVIDFETQRYILISKVD